MDTANLYAAAEQLVKVYKGDLEPCLGNELVQFVSLIHLCKKEYQKDQSKELVFYQIFSSQHFRATFPNINITLRMCSFLKIKILKN